MQCEEWADANSELFKEVHDEAVHKNSYKRKLYELISASLDRQTTDIIHTVFPNAGGSGACGARVQGLAGAWPLEASGSAHRAGWFRGEL